MVPSALNTTALTPVTLKSMSVSSRRGVITGIIFFAVAILTILGVIFFGGALYASYGRDAVALMTGIVTFAVVFILIGLLFAGGYYKHELRLRLQQFVKDNPAILKDYTIQTVTTGAGILFRHDTWVGGVAAYNIFTGKTTLPFTFGNLQYGMMHRIGYVAIRLPRRIPHMLLDNKSRHGSFIPSTFQKEQQLRLEGDFSDFYTLYAPVEYEADAFYVFTPDIMQLLIDKGAVFDIEIIGDMLYLFRKKKFRMDKATITDIIELIDAFSAKFSRRVDGYRDERVGDKTLNQIDVQGSVLRQREKLHTTLLGLSMGRRIAFTWIAGALVVLLLFGIIGLLAIFIFAGEWL